MLANTSGVNFSHKRNHKRTWLIGAAVLTLVCAGLLNGCDSKTEESKTSANAPPPAAQSSHTAPQQAAYPTEAYFGDTHVHTGWSADAGMDGAITTPDDAYRFAMGMEVKSNTGKPARLARAYDWFMVTDHSDGMGTINEIIGGNPEMMKSEVLQRWNKAFNSGSEKAAADAKSELIVLQSTGKLPPQIVDPKWMVSAWQKTVDAAEKYNKPGEFTTFIAFEWTVNADGGDNLHRNVIFRDGADKTRDLTPLTTFVTQDPHKLWDWMANYESTTGGRVLAIPHNGNMSNGRMFEEQEFDGTAMNPQWAKLRAQYEPLYEVTQIKGQSEAHPSLSPEDEFANWDLWDRGNLILKPKPEGALKYEYWREALKSGMRLEEALGTNPFQYGANAGTDTHTGLSTADDNNFFGKFKTVEPSAGRWDFPIISSPYGKYMGWEQAASGITGVWATANTREAIWDAMNRKETFATTGPRIKLRFFGGFNFTPSNLDGDLAVVGYGMGVPMGQKLHSAPQGKAASFIVAAMKDPDGANLDRVQIIKGWLDAEGETHEKVFNVVWSDHRKQTATGKLPAVGNTVNMKTAEYTNSIGAAELKGVFVDPEFDSQQKAVYYARVLAIPTPRWTLYDKLRFGAKPGREVPLVQQERAFSSPIWYSP